MTKEMPFDEDVLTLIMGVTPDEPGQHGRLNMPKPSGDPVSIITQIRDLCEEFLAKCDKGDEEEKPEHDFKDKKKPEEEELEEDEETE